MRLASSSSTLWEKIDQSTITSLALQAGETRERFAKVLRTALNTRPTPLVEGRGEPAVAAQGTSGNAEFRNTAIRSSVPQLEA
jgi:hypothetical protein